MTTLYADVNDVKSNVNISSMLRLNDWKDPDLFRLIEWASAEIENKIGSQTATDNVIRQLCATMVWVKIASGLPTAHADGENRVSLLGVSSKWDSWIRETLSDYGYGAPNPVWTEL